MAIKSPKVSTGGKTGKPKGSKMPKGSKSC